MFGRSFIWSADGWNQHYKALIYYSRYIREIILTFITEFRIVIPQWDLYIGEGSDIIQTLHYYAIGDPFNILCFLVPTAYMHIYFDFAIILRIYVAGLIFIKLIRYEGITDEYGIQVGAINYCFCQYIICMMSYHPYFLNPMVFLPLLVFAVEKVLYERRYSWMIVSVALAGVSNIYFFYIYVIMIIIFVIVRLLTFKFASLKAALGFLFGIVWSSVFGVMLGAVIIFPVVFSFMNDSRLGSGNSIHLFYPIEYYLSLPKVLFMDSNKLYELYVGVSAIGAVILVYKFVTGIRGIKKDKLRYFKNNPIACLAFISFIFIIFPFFGQMMNGMTYRCNRWSFALELLISFIVAKEWNNIMDIEKKDGLLVGVILSVYLIFIFFIEQSRDIYVIEETALSLCTLVFLVCIKDKTEIKQRVCFLLLIASVVVLSHHRFSISLTGGTENRAGINFRLHSNEAFAVKAIAEKDGVNEPFRYASNPPTMNAGMLEKVSATNFFFSNANPYHVKYEKNMGVSNDMDFFHIDYNERDILLEMAAVRYFATQDEQLVPDGYFFKETYTDGKYKEWYIYENAFPLSLTYSYPLNGGFLEEEVWNSFTETQRQEAMLKYALIDKPLEVKSEGTKIERLENVEELDYEINSNHDGIIMDNNAFYVMKDDAVLVIHTNCSKGKNLYLNIKNVSNEKINDYDLYHTYSELSTRAGVRSMDWKDCHIEDKWSMIKDKFFYDNSKNGAVMIATSDSGKGNAMAIANPDSSWYSGSRSFAIDFGVQPDYNGDIYLRFPTKGVYSFEDIRVYSVSRSSYRESIENLSKIGLDNLHMETNRISGNIICDDDRLLCFSIPFLEGWSAYIDGQKTKVYNTNILYTGIVVPKGEHSIVLEYNTPFLQLGIIVSIISFSLFILYYYLCVRKREKNAV
ncbi:MAG: YfhO family protein [Lachnospiraceae bacterium]|nr:YfhO family protein [Lachnospiraceae bacterium]